MIANNQFTTGGVVVLINTVLAPNLEGPDCSGPVTSQGNNLIGDPTGCSITLLPSDLTGDPGLDAFTDNDTPGNGHFPLLPTSQAIDVGNDAECPRRDQLGQRRINIRGVGTSICDIGAIEFHPDDQDPVEESERLSRMSSRSDVNDSVAEAELLSLLNLNGRERI